MVNKARDDAGDKPSIAKKPVAALIVVILLSLATWSFFYVRQMSLTPADTGIVVGFWLLVVFSVRWIFGQLARKRDKNAGTKNN